VSKNKSLQYLDLDNSGLSHKIIVEMVPSFMRAKSLLSFHLGYNPGFERRLQILFMAKMKMFKKCVPHLALHVQKEDEISDD
jgi:hypothetical protein